LRKYCYKIVFKPYQLASSRVSLAFARGLANNIKDKNCKQTKSILILSEILKNGRSSLSDEEWEELLKEHEETKKTEVRLEDFTCSLVDSASDIQAENSNNPPFNVNNEMTRC